MIMEVIRKCRVGSTDLYADEAHRAFMFRPIECVTKYSQRSSISKSTLATDGVSQYQEKYRPQQNDAQYLLCRSELQILVTGQTKRLLCVGDTAGVEDCERRPPWERSR